MYNQQCVHYILYIVKNKFYLEKYESHCYIGCGPSEWTCRNGDCIPDIRRCDGTPQCIDRSDEENCRPEPPGLSDFC